MSQQPAVYRIYLLTIHQQVDAAKPIQAVDEQQQNDARGHLIWRFTIEDPRTGQRRSFSSVMALAAALQAEFPNVYAPLDPEIMSGE